MTTKPKLATGLRKKRGSSNPNWGKMQPLAINPTFLSDFDRIVLEYNLKPDQYEGSAILQAWCKKHKNNKFVPESLLKAWGITPEMFLDWGEVTDVQVPRAQRCIS